jgi:predicted nucleic acid-binding protein
MPSKTPEFAVLDTSVYIENFRSGRFALPLLRSSFIPRCSSVVLHELLRGARSGTEQRFVRDLLRRCQIVTPTSGHWVKAAEILAQMRRHEHFGATKLRDLAFDVLIALSARSIGAVVITCNAADFQAIRKYLAFRLVYWE